MKILISPCSFIFILIIVCLLLPLFSNSSPSVHKQTTLQGEVVDSVAAPIYTSIEE